MLKRRESTLFYILHLRVNDWFPLVEVISRSDHHPPATLHILGRYALALSWDPTAMYTIDTLYTKYMSSFWLLSSSLQFLLTIFSTRPSPHIPLFHLKNMHKTSKTRRVNMRQPKTKAHYIRYLQIHHQDGNRNPPPNVQSKLTCSIFKSATCYQRSLGSSHHPCLVTKEDPPLPFPLASGGFCFVLIFFFP